MGTTQEAVDRIKLGCGEGVGAVLSGGSIEGEGYGNLEGAGPGDGDTMYNLEGTRVGT